jgi:peptidyl-tRNA hydrolase, PTH1 family
MSDYEWLVAGLGNPGREYEFTPHNLGFMVVDSLATAHGVRVSRKENMALVGLGSIGGKPVVLAKPQTYMNESGGSVKGLLDRYELDRGRLIVVYDELDLPWQSMRVKPKGSAAGHNGMKSVIASIGTSDFPRVRLGIHPGHPVKGAPDYFVLVPFRRGQKKEVEDTVERGREAVESIIAEGVEKAMTKFNRRAQGSEEDK